MIRLMPAGILVTCDSVDVDDYSCRARARVEVDVPSAPWSVEAMFVELRARGWRVHSAPGRRDLCPDHHEQARARLTLIDCAAVR